MKNRADPNKSAKSIQTNSSAWLCLFMSAAGDAEGKVEKEAYEIQKR